MFKKIGGMLDDKDLESDKRIPVAGSEKTYICPDFYSEKGKVIGEIHAHAGRLKKAFKIHFTKTLSAESAKAYCTMMGRRFFNTKYKEIKVDIYIF